MKDIAVLLTVFNRCEKTISCLKNLYAQKLPKNVSFDVWLTDDNCTDDTPLVIAKEYPKVHILTSEGGLFWNRGMINAWEAAAKYKDYDAYLWLMMIRILIREHQKCWLKQLMKLDGRKLQLVLVLNR